MAVAGYAVAAVLGARTAPTAQAVALLVVTLVSPSCPATRGILSSALVPASYRSRRSMRLEWCAAPFLEGVAACHPLVDAPFSLPLLQGASPTKLGTLDRDFAVGAQWPEQVRGRSVLVKSAGSVPAAKRFDAQESRPWGASRAGEGGGQRPC